MLHCSRYLSYETRQDKVIEVIEVVNRIYSLRGNRVFILCVFFSEGGEGGAGGADTSIVRQEEIDRISRKLATLEMKVNRNEALSS